MPYHSTSTNSGFTLFEIVISLGILATLAVITIPYTIHLYQGYQIDTERTLVVALLREARTMSLAGNGSADHGLHVYGSDYTLFEGPTYAGRDQSKDETFPRETAITITGPSEIIFKYLSARTASTSFTLDNGTKQTNIYVNKEGRIDW